MFSFSTTGDFKNTERFLSRHRQSTLLRALSKFGRLGVDALASATPHDTGETALRWTYEAKVSRTGATLAWTNSNMAGNTPVPILLQYGHGTGTGGFVQGRDFINPALRPVFDTIAEGVWKEVNAK